MQHSSTSAALLTLFILNHASPSLNSRKMSALMTRFGAPYSRVSMRHESKRSKKSSSWLNSGNALIQHLSEKCDLCVSLFYQALQKHKLFEVA